MNRREILRYTAYVTGAAVSAPLAATILSGCKTESSPVADAAMAFFDEGDMDLIKKVINTIIPKTDSPSATDVGVHSMIDHMVGNIYSQGDRQNYSEAISMLLNHINTTDDIQSAVAALEGSSSDIGSKVRDAYHQLKEQTVAYYLSSEEVATKFLNYLPIPGEYQSCITLEEAGGKRRSS